MFKIKLNSAIICALVMMVISLIMPTFANAANESGARRCGTRRTRAEASFDREEAGYRYNEEYEEILPRRSMCQKALISTAKQLAYGCAFVSGTLFVLSTNCLLSVRCLTGASDCREALAFSAASGATMVAAASLYSSMNEMYRD